MSKIDAVVTVWALGKEYHINNELYAASVQGVEPCFKGTFQDIPTAREWLCDVLVAYFDWRFSEAAVAVSDAIDQIHCSECITEEIG